MACKVFRRGPKRQDFDGKTLGSKAFQGRRGKGSLFHQEGMVEAFGEVADRPLEFTEIQNHSLHGSFGLQLFLLQIGDDLPTVSMEVLALPVVIGKEVGAVETAFSLQSVQGKPFPLSVLGAKGLEGIIRTGDDLIAHAIAQTDPSADTEAVAGNQKQFEGLGLLGKGSSIGF